MIFPTIPFKSSVLLLLLAAGLPLAAQDKSDVRLDDKDIVRISPTPTVIEKFTALQMRMEEQNLDWVRVYNANQIDFDPDDLTDKDVHMPVALGIRMTDGIIAIMAKHAESLNSSADDIEKIAKKLGVSDKDLARAKQVQAFANRGAWNRVYMELGWLQRDVMTTLDRDGNRDRRSLLLCAGWLQAAYITSGLVKDNYNADRSTLLREPIMLRALIAELDTVKDSSKSTPIFKALHDAMTQTLAVVDTPVGQAIPLESIEKIHAVTQKFRETVVPR
jgi:hypothetical protein